MDSDMGVWKPVSAGLLAPREQQDVLKVHWFCPSTELKMHLLKKS